ncbi:MAG: 4a-hydroxytetrahydrobiopterin dehydratase [Gammaproteobacteria bacterium]|jgi:4a-hydroxytetrahydrobiopterin dehydratase
MTDLRARACKGCEGEVAALSSDERCELLKQIDTSWKVSGDQTTLNRDYSFLNFDQTMAFVNALAWVARKENHHPDITLGYNYCTVLWTTHALKALSENDFICAAKTDALLEN